MMTFKEFLEELETLSSFKEEMAANNIAGSGATQIARYDPIMRFKMFRRKPSSKKTK